MCIAKKIGLFSFPNFVYEIFLQAPVVQMAYNFIHWIARYPADRMCVRFSR